MRCRNSKSVLLLSSALLLFGFGIPKNLDKKINKEVEATFDVENVLYFTIEVPDELNKKLPTRITEDNFYRVSRNDALLGYVFTDQASSKTAKFDYLVVFNSNLEIVSSKVLVYREEYGGEIGSKRWLKQFIGKNGKDRVDSESNIDGISGATISVRSMTNAIDNLLQTVGLLQDNNVLP